MGRGLGLLKWELQGTREGVFTEWIFLSHSLDVQGVPNRGGGGGVWEGAVGGRGCWNQGSVHFRHFL